MVIAALRARAASTSPSAGIRWPRRSRSGPTDSHRRPAAPPVAVGPWVCACEILPAGPTGVKCAG